MDKSRHSIGATGEADDEAGGRPEWFKKNGYAATDEERFHAMSIMGRKFAAASALRSQSELSRNANVMIARDYLDQAMQAIVGSKNSDALSLIAKAIKELEK